MSQKCKNPTCNKEVKPKNGGGGNKGLYCSQQCANVTNDNTWKQQARDHYARRHPTK